MRYSTVVGHFAGTALLVLASTSSMSAIAQTTSPPNCIQFGGIYNCIPVTGFYYGHSGVSVPFGSGNPPNPSTWGDSPAQAVQNFATIQTDLDLAYAATHNYPFWDEFEPEGGSCDLGKVTYDLAPVQRIS
jgi:hypothetical protein